MTDFRLLTRTFFQRFFDTELVSSVMELQQLQVVALVFLAMPGFFFSVDSAGFYISIARRMPWLLDRLSLPHKLFFVTYSMLVVGTAAIVVWDSLTIDRRDATILGVLPIRARTIVAAKLASLVTFLMILAAAMNVPAAFAYAFDMGETRTLALIVRGRDARARHLVTIDDAVRQSSGWRFAFTWDMMNPDANPQAAPRRLRTSGIPGNEVTTSRTRPTGYSELAAAYGLHLVTPPRILNPPASYHALADGTVDVIAGDETAPLLRKLDLVALTDNREVFSPYPGGITVAIRSIAGQLVATIGAAAWVFTTLITLQGVFSLLPYRLRSICTVAFQVLFVTSLFSLFVMMPMALRASAAAVERASDGTSGPLWLVPPLWFLGIHETVLGSTRPLFHALARTAFAALGVSTLSATLVVLSSYRHRLRASVAGATGSVTWRFLERAKAAAITLIAPAPDTRAAFRFALITLARSRPHQLLVATYAGAGVALTGAVLLRAVATGGVQSLMHLRVAVLWVPLVLFLSMLLGIRAAFRLPAELSAAWTFHFHAREPAHVYAAATRRAAMVIAIVPVLAIAFAVYAAMFGAAVAALHVAFCAIMGLALLEWLFRGFDQIPFTRAYNTGESKARRWWWPFFIFVIESYAHWPVAAEIGMLQSPANARVVLPLMVACLLLLQWGLRRRVPRDMPLVFEVQPESALSTLDLSGSSL